VSWSPAGGTSPGPVGTPVPTLTECTAAGMTIPSACISMHAVAYSLMLAQPLPTMAVAFSIVLVGNQIPADYLLSGGVG
jgi:hypothetical protein